MYVRFCGVEYENNIATRRRVVWQIGTNVSEEPDALGYIWSLNTKLTCSPETPVPTQHTA